MYEQFFDLTTKPFELVPDPDFLFMGKSHKKAMMYLDYGIKEKIGFLLLTGEIGSGKTTLLRNLIKQLSGSVVLSKVFNTMVTSDQLLALINEDFGLTISGKDRLTLLRELNEFLIEQYAQQNQAILVIDEAQNLTPELLEEVRLLSNLETDKHKLLQIILVGQPELRKSLSRPELTQLRQRISISCHINPLDVAETEQYILHRLERAGKREAIVFQAGTIQSIHRFSRGIPRLINIICDFLMLSAYAENTRELENDLVKDVIGELEEENRYWEEAAQDSSELQSGESLYGKRIEHLEHVIHKNELSLENITNIVQRLADNMKTIPARTLHSHRDLLGDIDGKLSLITESLDALDHRLIELEKRDTDVPEAKKRGLWGWKSDRE